MPASYAHFRLGREIFPRLEGSVRAAAEAFPQLYDIGLHGPDVLFYHKPLKATRLNRMASPLHDKSGRAFFRRAAAVLRESDDRRASLAYAAGCLCHFALDAVCHGYVEEVHRSGRVSHAAIEADLDRELLVRDGKAPFRHRMAAHIHATRENARRIAPFYPRVSPEEMREALQGMKRYSGLLHPRYRLQRAATRKVLAAAAPGFSQLILPEAPNPACRETTRTLLSLYPEAVQGSLRIIREFEQALPDKPLQDALFRFTFNGQRIEREDELL